MDNTSDIKYFDEGYTFYMFPTAIIFLIVGALAFAANVILAVSFILLGVLFLLVQSGTAIDLNNKSISRYKRFMNYKMHDWYSLANVERIKIDYDTDNIRLNSRGSSTTVNQKSYNMYFVGPGINRKFHEYNNHPLALKIGTILSNKLDIKLEDKVSEIQRRAIKNRRR